MLYELVSRDHVQQLRNEISNTRMTVLPINSPDQYLSQVLVVDAWVEVLHINCRKTCNLVAQTWEVVRQEIRTAANRVLQLVLNWP